MAPRPPKNDIHIGEGEWITFGDLADGQSQAVEVDPYLATVMPFIESLETECVAECCGIGAFVLLPDEIKKAAARSTRRELDDLLSKLVSAEKVIETLPSSTVVSMRMNQYFRKSVFLAVLAHIRKVVEGVQWNA